MVRITRTEIFIKVVYYGPGLSGKTTNLEVIHKQLPDQSRGDLTSIATETDRTIFFDCLPFEAPSPDGRILKLQLFTIPGQVYYKSTRQLILRGADGTVFVADSQENKMEENRESLRDLYEILDIYRVDLEKMPLVLQYNKRDLDNISSLEEMEKELNHSRRPSFCASAINRIGIMETLKRILRIIMSRLKFFPKEEEEELKTHMRRKELVDKLYNDLLHPSEWTEFLNLHMDTRRRGAVGEMVEDLKTILQKKISTRNQLHTMEICETIVNLDPGEHKIQTLLQSLQKSMGRSKPSSTAMLDRPAEIKNLELTKDPDTSFARVVPPVEKKEVLPPTLPSHETGVATSAPVILEEKSETLRRIQKQVEENPGDLTLRKKMLNLFIKNNMEKEAIHELITTAQIHFQNGKLELCRRCLEYVIKLDPDHTQARSMLSILS